MKQTSVLSQVTNTLWAVHSHNLDRREETSEFRDWRERWLLRLNLVLLWLELWFCSGGKNYSAGVRMAGGRNNGWIKSSILLLPAVDQCPSLFCNLAIEKGKKTVISHLKMSSNTWGDDPAHTGAHFSHADSCSHLQLLRSLQVITIKIYYLLHEQQCLVCQSHGHCDVLNVWK